MGTIRRLSDIQIGSIGTTKILSITTSETLYSISSGNRAFEATNLGAYTIYYGQSNLSANSGGILISNGAKFWDTVTDNFTMYFRVLSSGVTSNLTVQEYAGN